MKFAVSLGCDFEGDVVTLISSWELDGLPDQVCRKGEGCAGVVGFAMELVRSLAGVVFGALTPLDFGVGGEGCCTLSIEDPGT